MWRHQYYYYFNAGCNELKQFEIEMFFKISTMRCGIRAWHNYDTGVIMQQSKLDQTSEVYFVFDVNEWI